MIHIKLFRFLTTSLFFLIFFLPNTQAQVFWSETFNDENTANSNWLNGGTNPGPADWTWTNLPSAGYQDPDLPAFAAPTATDGYFYFDSDNNGQAPHDVWLTGPVNSIDCTGKNNVQLRFFTQYIYFNPEGTQAQVGVSTNGVDFEYKNVFAGLQANFPYHDWAQVDLDEADNQAQVWLRFRWIGNYEYHWKVDDLELFEACDPGQAGSFTLPLNGALCLGDQLEEALTIDSSAFVLAATGPVYGLAWCYSAAPIPANTWPGDIPGLISTPFLTDVHKPSLVNDGNTLAHGLYYLTPIVLSGGVLLNPAEPANVSNIDPAGGCFALGQSKQLVLLPAVAPLTASGVVTNEQVPPGNNGSIVLDFGGGSGAFFNNPAQYEFLWSDGSTTADLTDLASGTYTVTLSDASGCTDALVATFTVEETVSSKNPAIVQTLRLRPNPSTGIVLLDLQLRTASTLHYELRNIFGQLVAQFEAGNTADFQGQLDLSNFAEGAYLLNLRIGRENVQRLILIQR